MWLSFPRLNWPRTLPYDISVCIEPGSKIDDLILTLRSLQSLALISYGSLPNCLLIREVITGSVGATTHTYTHPCGHSLPLIFSTILLNNYHHLIYFFVYCLVPLENKLHKDKNICFCLLLQRCLLQNKCSMNIFINKNDNC